MKMEGAKRKTEESRRRKKGEENRKKGKKKKRREERRGAVRCVFYTWQFVMQRSGRLGKNQFRRGSGSI